MGIIVVRIVFGIGWKIRSFKVQNGHQDCQNGQNGPNDNDDHPGDYAVGLWLT